MWFLTIGQDCRQKIARQIFRWTCWFQVRNICAKRPAHIGLHGQPTIKIYMLSNRHKSTTSTWACIVPAIEVGGFCAENSKWFNVYLGKAELGRNLNVTLYFIRYLSKRSFFSFFEYAACQTPGCQVIPQRRRNRNPSTRKRRRHVSGAQGEMNLWSLSGRAGSKTTEYSNFCLVTDGFNFCWCRLTAPFPKHSLSQHGKPGVCHASSSAK
jgi:hypothetical protein